ncbi:MAG: aldo/keto reductase [Proteobacteria bacterium]|nr:MAG: aldo/keto reductase [Pseudomonadota bacterium]
MHDLSRREFVGLTITAALASGLPVNGANTENPAVEYRTLGRTGVKVSALGLGGYHIGMQKDENESIKIIRAAIDGGINFLDNCWDYNNGTSEVRMGKALKDGYRQKVFLMTKIDGRTKQEAAKQIDESLKRLQTDHLDLMQFHEVIRFEDPDRIFAQGGAREAMQAAKQAGKVRLIGFTGHKNPDIHLKMLATAKQHNFHFDAVQMPLNVMDAHFESFEKKVLPELVKDEIGVLGMKPMGDPFILKSNTVTPIECLHYAMSLPTNVVITGIDSMQVLQQDLQVLHTFRKLDEKQMAALLAKTAPVANAGKFELYKTTHHFDGTVQNPQWLG